MPVKKGIICDYIFFITLDVIIFAKISLKNDYQRNTRRNYR